MTMYSYKCRTCGATFDCTTRADSIGACTCGGEFRRDYSGIKFDRVMQEHYNQTTKTAISSNRQFDNELRRQSEIRSEELGMEHRFERVDPSDKKALGVTDEGIDQSNRIRREQGLPTFKV